MDNGTTDITTCTTPFDIYQLTKAERSAVNRLAWSQFKRLPELHEIPGLLNQIQSLGQAPTRSELTTEQSLARLSIFKSNRSDILAAKALEILDAMTPDKLAGSDLKSLSSAFKEISTQERLEQGKATSIQQLWGMVVGQSDTKLKARMADMPAIHVEDLNK